MKVKEEIHAQIVGALAGTKFPIKTPEALLAAFPQGAETTCKADGVELKAGDAGKVLKPDDFPFQFHSQAQRARPNASAGSRSH